MPALAAVLLRVWAFWLNGFERSSTGYLLEHFVRRPGRIVTHRDGHQVVLEPRPLDLVLRRAGYLDPLRPPAPLAATRLAFRIRENR